jgi:hypothetical protein
MFLPPIIRLLRIGKRVDDEDFVLVKMIVTYPSKYNPHVEETSFHQFIDMAPEFEISNEMLEVYLEMDGVHIDMWHLDIPKPVELLGTHQGTDTVQ